MLKYFDDGNRIEFLRHWSQHVPSTVIDSDPSLKSLEFLIYAHFAIYHLRPNCPYKVYLIHSILLIGTLFFRMTKPQKKICKSLKLIWNPSKDKRFLKQVKFYHYLLYRLSLHRINMLRFKSYSLFVEFPLRKMV